MELPASQYTPEYFQQKKKKYTALLQKKKKRTDTLLTLVKKNLINCALHLADNTGDVDAIFWICEKFTERDPDISISEKEFKKYIKINAIEKTHLPSMELLAKYYLKDGDDRPSADTGGFMPDIFKKDTEIKFSEKNIQDVNAKKSTHKSNKNTDQPNDENSEVSKKAAFSSMQDEAEQKRKAVTAILKKDMPPLTREKVYELLKPFDDLTGMDVVKRQIKQLAYNMIAQSKRRKHKIDTDYKPSLHMVFSGNPGTGKTTIARLLGGVLKELGYLTKGHVVEVDRSALVGSYIGHTEYYTSEAIKNALGGVLFIDEAYGLNKGFDWDFGAEAIELIIKYMEDHRDDLVVIFAGYPKEMEWFVKMNPGLQSRIAITLDFPDYSDEELTQIFEKNAKEQGFEIDDLALEKVRLFFKKMSANDKQKFGNARGVRNLFEKTLQNQSFRIVEHDVDDKKQLLTILLQDVQCDKLNKSRIESATITNFDDK